MTPRGAPRAADGDPPFARARHVVSRLACWLVVHAWFRVRREGFEGVPSTPVIYCFNHLNWIDPIVLMGTLPFRPRLALFGPKEADMSAGARNRLIAFTGLAVPYRPDKHDMIATTRRVAAVIGEGRALAIAGEGRIHRGERDLLPLSDGPAYFALRTGVPIVPLAINGTSWLGFRHRVRIRAGTPIPAAGRPTSEAVDALTAATARALLELVADFPDPRPPGRFGRWLTERFNEWPEGARPDPPPGTAGLSGPA